jgi:Mn2+/Fe2+ NRAMP family transporter
MTIRPAADQIKQPDRPKLADIMGPGLITGASDDDPSGIATYSQAGAQFGYSLGWTLVLAYPLMCAIQMISAQVGRVTGKGLAGNMRRHYPAPVIYPLIALLLVANVINIGADLGAMAAALRLLVEGPQLAFVAAFAVVTVLLEVFMRYSRYASVLRWLALSLLAYVATVFAVGVPWLTVAQNLVVPHIKLSGDYLAIVVAIFGTTISPYLFFWQAAEEVEDEKEDPKAEPLIEAPVQAPRQLARIQLDTLVGMGISNLVALFIMITTADPECPRRDRHPDFLSSSGRVAPYRRTLRFYCLCIGYHRDRHARVASPRRQRRVCVGRNPELACWPSPTTGTRSSLLRHNRGCHTGRSRSQFHPS